MNNLFAIERQSQMRNAALDQFMTPEWAAEALVSEFFGDLTANDLVLEPTCGRGAFLKAIPAHVQAIGVEIDEQLAHEAAANTGRRVLCGDFRTIELPENPTAIIGNPPFKMHLLDALLERSRHWLPENGRCGLIVSAYMVQTPSTVLRWNDHWSLEQRILPRTLFPRAIRPLVFLMFTKDRLRRMLGGFALYRESAEINGLGRQAKLLLIHGTPNKTCWRAVVEWGLRQLGGKAHVRELYQVIEPHRPTENRWWQEKVRQTLQRHFVAVERGVWAAKARAA
jgi:site-specific DNA-methyltransferase (adenine-specific)